MMTNAAKTPAEIGKLKNRLKGTEEVLLTWETLLPMHQLIWHVELYLHQFGIPHTPRIFERGNVIFVKNVILS